MADPQYLLVKRGLYYRPNSQGYTGIKANAGRYLATDAMPDSGVFAVREDVAPMFSKSCFDDLAIKHLTSRYVELAKVLGEILPLPLCGEGWSLPDDERVQISITFGILKRARAVLAQVVAEGPQADLGTYPMDIPDEVDGLTYRAQILQAMAERYFAAVPHFGHPGAVDAALATWNTDWPSDPEPRTIANGIEAADSDLEHMRDDC